ncbi:MAG: CBS domain-containing protein, partial [Spirochaetales bacterium]|nr:CBS domain-containing protein [Spirochaetales bacterium]
MDIKNWITVNPATVEIDQHLSAAIDKMVELSIGAVIVTDKGKLAGIITERDVL